jgi:hypothetical protein
MQLNIFVRDILDYVKHDENSLKKGLKENWISSLYKEIYLLEFASILIFKIMSSYYQEKVWNKISSSKSRKGWRVVSEWNQWLITSQFTRITSRVRLKIIYIYIYNLFCSINKILYHELKQFHVHLVK